MIPRDWDFTGHRGFWRQGVIKARSMAGPRVELAWRPAQHREDLPKLAAKLLPGVEWRPWEVSTGQANVTASQGLTVGPADHRGRRLFMAQTKQRLAVLTLDQVEPALARRIAQSLTLAEEDQPQSWAVLEFALKSPAGYEMVEAAIQAGACLLRWRRGRRHLRVRRFSAGHAAMGLPLDADLDSPQAMQRFESWVGLVYAREVADARHSQETSTDAQGRVRVTLRSKPRRLAAMEVTALIPRHRKQYRLIQVVWDKPACKVLCIESTHDDESAQSLADGVLDSWATFDCPPPAHLKLPIRGVVKLPVKTHAGDQGRLLVEVEHPRPKALGWMPLLLGQKPNHQPVIHRAELDPIGSWLWDRLGKIPGGENSGGKIPGEKFRGKNSGEGNSGGIDGIINQLQQSLRLSAREARMATMTYLHLLAKWRMIDIQLPSPPESPESPEGSSPPSADADEA